MSQRKCSVFYCDYLRGRVCCADCQKPCKNRCQNTPEYCGLVQEVPRAHRRANLLPEKEIEQLYWAGDNDREIGMKLSVKKERIQHWRAIHGLPSNEIQKYKRAKAMAVELYRSGITCGEISEKVGYTVATVRKWTKGERENG